MNGQMSKKFKFITVKESGLIRYSWNPSDKEKMKLEKNENIAKQIYNKIRYVEIIGLQQKTIDRPVRLEIRNIIKKMRCVSCGTNKDIEVDHKNGLYNDKRVLNIKTQKLEDFQPLCRHCNIEKREIIKKIKSTGIRPSATLHPIFSIFNIDFYDGDTSFDINNPNALVGVLWYDFMAFTRYIKDQFHHKNVENQNVL